MRVDLSLIQTSALEEAVTAQASQRRSLMPQSAVLPVLLGRSAEVASWAQTRLSGDFDPVPEQVVTVRKTRHGVRPVAELFLRDQLLYRALVGAWLDRLPEPERSSEAFDTFEEAPLGEPEAAYVVSSDIVAFYQYIDYDLLSRELVARTGDAARVDTLIELLTIVTGRRFGIPQQNNPSDWLAECYIDVLERRLIRSGVAVWRYNDDFRITADSWPNALAAVDLLDREARRLGLALNDSKTIIRKRDTYQTAVSRREQVRQEIAEEAELDLTGIDFGPYGTADIPPDPDDVRIHAFTKILERWREHADDDPAVLQALVQLIPTALAHLALSPGTTTEILDTCMELLRTEQTLTPAVAQYLERIHDDDQPLALDAFDRLLDTNPYLTPWQASWLAPALARMQALAVGDNGVRRAAWLKSVWDDPRAPEPVRAAIAQTLAQHKVLTTDDLLDVYDRMAETSRPALAAALGTAKLDPTSKKAHALTAEDDLIRWQYEWGLSLA
jgi:RNA-directed DNA polymerase